MRYYLSRYRYELVIWLFLMALVAINLFVSFVPLGLGNLIVNEVISTVMMLTVAVYFMHLRSATSVLHLAAGAGVFWLAVFFLLTFSDVLTRTDILLR